MRDTPTSGNVCGVSSPHSNSDHEHDRDTDWWLVFKYMQWTLMAAEVYLDIPPGEVLLCVTMSGLMPWQ